MPKPRNKENLGLPSRWKFQHGAYYYQVPPGLELLWDGKKLFRLGKSLPEAYRNWSSRIDANEGVKTIAQLLDRYALEVVPAKALKTQSSNLVFIKTLRSASFHAWPLTALKPRHVYAYVDARSAKVSAHREVEILSHAFTKAVEWGYLDRHPFKGEVRFAGEKPRDRYVEDWELLECLNLESKRKSGSVDMIKAYLKLKLLTGLRRGDLLKLRMTDIQEDGIHVQPSKTRHSTGKRVIFSWTNDKGEDNGRLAAKDEALAARPCISPYLFCKRNGEGYINPVDDECHGWDSMWQRFMDRVLKETKVTERFTEHDLRAKAGSDAESVELAQKLLTHASVSTTKRIYRRKPEIVG
jgi:integrase